MILAKRQIKPCRDLLDTGWSYQAHRRIDLIAKISLKSKASETRDVIRVKVGQEYGRYAPRTKSHACQGLWCALADIKHQQLSTRDDRRTCPRHGQIRQRSSTAAGGNMEPLR